MSGSAITRTAPGTAVVRTLVPGSVTSSDLAEGLAAEEARANGAYVATATAAINIKHPDYGAVGDGATDDSVAIRAAIAGASRPVTMSTFLRGLTSSR